MNSPRERVACEGFGVTGLGYEQQANSCRITALSRSGGAESGARLNSASSMAQELAVLAKFWPNLPDSVRHGILAMVEASATGSE